MLIRRIRADPSDPCRSVFSSRFRGTARLRITRTPAATLSAIGYRLSPMISPRLARAKPTCVDYGGISPWLCKVKPACAGESGLFMRGAAPRAPASPVRVQRCCASSYAPRAVGLIRLSMKSAMRPLPSGYRLSRAEPACADWRIIYSKTIRGASPPRPLYGCSAAAPPRMRLVPSG